MKRSSTSIIIITVAAACSGGSANKRTTGASSGGSGSVVEPPPPGDSPRPQPVQSRKLDADEKIVLPSGATFTASTGWTVEQRPDLVIVTAPEGDLDGVGVGPWPGPWPDGPQYDPALLAAGDRRNVVDRYRYWRHEAIVADLDARRHDFHVAIENWQHDLNIGTVVRTANAFLAAAVHIVGRRRWNRRGPLPHPRQ